MQDTEGQGKNPHISYVSTRKTDLTSQCDEGKPSCRPCIKSNWPCEYPDRFRHNGSFPDAGSLQGMRITVEECTSSILSSPVSPGLPQCPEQQSVSFFMSRYVPLYVEKEKFVGIIDQMPNFYANASPSSPIALAIVTIALQCAAAEPTNHHFTSLSKSRYSKAISSIKDAICQLEKWESNHLLAAIWLLDVWEVSLGIMFNDFELN